MKNKIRLNFTFLPVSQVRTNTFFIVYFFIENLFSDNRFMWSRLWQKSQNNIGPLPESKLFNQTTQPLGKSRQKP